MKYWYLFFKCLYCHVAPLVGVWIEIQIVKSPVIDDIVAPLVGVWIEMIKIPPYFRKVLSLPSWECGLKYVCFRVIHSAARVAPLVGVWIEISA